MRRGATSGRASLDFRIRLARADEREELEAIQREASLATGEHRAELEANPDVIHLPNEQIEQGQVLVAESDDGIVGFAVVIIDHKRSELDGLFVKPEHWRNGIGHALVQAAAHRARRSGLSLTVVASPFARGFYERCGFTLEGEAQTRFGPALRMSR